ncbi:hypothetical protein [Rhodomicrobium vannielii]|uniref:hypothetical protein n=1 Tax=Rhodomicrobium vannielii TaxID=1069 RepID=UPI001AECC975|nr:hypothetical protein [Rhodomicrobium vannielii]
MCDPRQSIEKFSGLIAAYLNRLEVNGGGLEERSLTLIARSPSSAVAKALSLQASGLDRQQVSVQIIFSKLAPVDLLTELASALNLIAPRDDRRECVRLIRTPALLNAHEQLVMGTSICWTGDMLRRCEENRNGLDILEEDAPGSVRLAQFAFNAIWAIAKPVPTRILSGGNRLYAEHTPLAPAIAAAGLAAEIGPMLSSGLPATRH